MRQNTGSGHGRAESLTDPARWVEAHGDALFRFALVRVRDRQAAEELVQETFLAALAGMETFTGASSERTWLTGILKYKVIDYFRRRQREKRPEEEIASDAAYDAMFREDGHWKGGPGKWTVDAGVLLEREEFWGVFDDCLRGLPERAGQAFVLRVLDEGDAELVCQAMGITPTNLWALLHRARERLRKCLEVKWFMNKREEQ